MYGICILFFIAAMMTHIVACIMAHAFLLLLAGAIFFPIGVIHGVGIWFGVW